MAFRLEHGSEAQGFGQRIVDDHGVIALVKARGKAVGAGPILAAAPAMLAELQQVHTELTEAANLLAGARYNGMASIYRAAADRVRCILDAAESRHGSP
ncbi:hypothetical protein MKK88_00325 [Methylobacterium sp. E-005]|uniref:hypothetical protein n=1 Tax=Methylobacterium sp. E-005 TaxID=2836549 RepID=UPI001FB9C53B|nr:hypothetical protein [Methylobacterium sp. E-005]MCJ2084441.1 hypothetical protein [Methylobacterium sp. E-005]